MVEEADARVDVHLLGGGGLRGVSFPGGWEIGAGIGEVRGGGEGFEGAAVEGERDLNFGLVRVAVYEGGAGRGWVFGAHDWLLYG